MAKSIIDTTKTSKNRQYQQEAEITPWETLRKEGLRHLQQMTGHLWTDFNLHDPGVTIFEALCYAITDLEKRLSSDIKDVLTFANKDESQKQFFTPREVLTINPVTINDYRKLLIDIKEVKNAWIVPTSPEGPDLYYDKDNNSLAYDFTPGSRRLSMNGLYRVYIEKHSDSQTTDGVLLEKVRDKLHSHRNLCEDFVEISIMEGQTITVYTDIQIAEDADAADILAGIYVDLEQHISPAIKQYSLKSMLLKGKSIEDIYNGPMLDNGFIDDEELSNGRKPKELHSSDLIRIIMGYPEVLDVRKLFLAFKPGRDPNDPDKPVIIEKHEWALALDNTKAPVMDDFANGSIRLFKKDALCSITNGEVLAKMKEIKEQRAREIFENKQMDILPSLGTYQPQLTEQSLASTFPSIYGISEAGLPPGSSKKRKAQARQLTGYLLFFEQILVNYFQQLEKFKDIFSFQQNRDTMLKTYFSRLLPESLWKGDFEKVKEENVYTYNEEYRDGATDPSLRYDGVFKRKERILAHLLAQFNEKFADFALFGYKNKTLGLTDFSGREFYLKAKADYISEFPILSRNRYCAENYRAGTDRTRAGLLTLIGSKLGFDLHSSAKSLTDESDNFFLVEHILFRPHHPGELDFICSEKIGLSHQPDPYSYRMTFVIPKKAGRFTDPKFKDLVYTTIEEETPAHLSYTIVELDPVQMGTFKTAYTNFNAHLASAHSSNPQANPHRNTLMEILGVGRAKLPMVHLDAHKISGSAGIPAETKLDSWFDLSRNNNHAEPVDQTTKPEFYEDPVSKQPFVKFEKNAQLKIAQDFFKEDFTFALVYKASASKNKADDFFCLLTDKPDPKENDGFKLEFDGRGGLRAALFSQQTGLESTLNVLHMALFCWDRAIGKLSLYIDGFLNSQIRFDPDERGLSDRPLLIGMGDNSPAECLVGEIIVTDSVLTGSRREKLEHYFSQKWQIPISAVASIAEPDLFFDSQEDRTVEKNSGTNRLLKWHNTGKKGLSMVQEISTLRPHYSVEGINSFPAIDFSLSQLIYTTANQTSIFQDKFTLAFVYKADRGGGCLFDGKGDTPANGFMLTIEDTGEIVLWGPGNEKLELKSSLNRAHFVLITGKIAAGKLEVCMELDGISRSTISFSDPNTFKNCQNRLYVGTDRNEAAGFRGSVGEIVLIDKALDVWDTQRLVEYFSRKWKIDSSGINPVASPAVHLDASLQRSVGSTREQVLDDTFEVTGWADRGFYKAHAREISEKRRPRYAPEGINKKGAINFLQVKTDADKFDDGLLLDRTIGSDFTLMVVFEADPSNVPQNDEGYTGWTEGNGLLDADCSGPYYDFGISIGKTKSGNMVVMGGIGDRVDGDHTIISGDVNFTGPHFVTFTRSRESGEVRLYVDGLLHAKARLSSNAVLNDSRFIRIGAFNSHGNPFRGKIGEVIILDQVISESQRQYIEKNFSEKWNIPLQILPINQSKLEVLLDACHKDSFILEDSFQAGAEPGSKAVARWMAENSTTAASQDIFAKRPLFISQAINGKPAVRFNNSFLNISGKDFSLTDFTIALVIRPISSGNTDWPHGAGIIDNYDRNGGKNFGLNIIRDSNDKSVKKIAARFDQTVTEASSPVRGAHIVILTRDSSHALKLYVDGLQRAGCDPAAVTPDPGSSGSLTLGAVALPDSDSESQGYYHGDIGEVIIFSKVLSKPDRQTLEEYLSGKWKIDITGFSNMPRPVIHLDAGKITSVKQDSQHAAESWLDSLGHILKARQDKKNLRPLYKKDSSRGLGVLEFGRSGNKCMKLPRLVQDDFTICIVFKADKNIDRTESMEVPPHVFTRISGVNSIASEDIWENLKTGTVSYLDNEGNLKSSFDPVKPDFSLNINDTLLTDPAAAIYEEIIALLVMHKDKVMAVEEHSFTAINGIGKHMSATLKKQLTGPYLDVDGYVKPHFAISTADYNVTLPQTSYFFGQAALSEVILLLTRKRNSFSSVTLEDLSRIKPIGKYNNTFVWNYLKDTAGIIDNSGTVLDKFKRTTADFIFSPPGLDDSGAEALKTMLLEKADKKAGITDQDLLAITGIGTVKLPQIKKWLINQQFLLAGLTVRIEAFFDEDLFKKAIGSKELFRECIVDVLLAQKWFPGTGLFDANIPGDRSELSKRDFGILIGPDKDDPDKGKIKAVMGVSGGRDHSIEATVSYEDMHTVILTRQRSTGLTRLYIDNTMVQARIGRGVSLRASNTFTIGAKNTGGGFFKGEVAEIIIFDRVPGDQEITGLKEYLSDKWGTLN